MTKLIIEIVHLVTVVRRHDIESHVMCSGDLSGSLGICCEAEMSKCMPNCALVSFVLVPVKG